MNPRRRVAEPQACGRRAPNATKAREHEPPGPSSSRAPRWRTWRRDVWGSAHLVQPPDGGTVARVAEHLQLLVPRNAQEQVDLVLECLDVTARAQNCLAEAVLLNDGVTRGGRHGVV